MHMQSKEFIQQDQEIDIASTERPCIILAKLSNKLNERGIRNYGDNPLLKTLVSTDMTCFY